MGRGPDWSDADTDLLIHSLANGRGPAWIAREYGWSLSSVKKMVRKVRDSAGEKPMKHRHGKASTLCAEARGIIEDTLKGGSIETSPKELQKLLATRGFYVKLWTVRYHALKVSRPWRQIQW